MGIPPPRYNTQLRASLCLLTVSNSPSVSISISGSLPPSLSLLFLSLPLNISFFISASLSFCLSLSLYLSTYGSAMLMSLSHEGVFSHLRERAVTALVADDRLATLPHLFA